MVDDPIQRIVDLVEVVRQKPPEQDDRDPYEIPSFELEHRMDLTELGVDLHRPLW